LLRGEVPLHGPRKAVFLLQSVHEFRFKTVRAFHNDPKINTSLIEHWHGSRRDKRIDVSTTLE
jgi:hypothetical protein